MIPQRKGSEFMVELSLQAWGDGSVPGVSAGIQILRTQLNIGRVG